MHVKPEPGIRAYASDTITDVVSRAKDTHTPNRVIRIEDPLWGEYEDACKDAGTTRTADLRAHMERRVRDWKAGRWPTPKADGKPKA